MFRPHDFRGVAGRNFANGFDFVHTVEHADATKEAIKALDALQYDFAAIDMLRGEDGKIYILEANSAPGVIKSGAQRTLHKLVDRIEEWDRAGHPTR
jgi:glutathione synthase/RimK-type ligase-like ATP-grasp enzyme